MRLPGTVAHSGSVNGRRKFALIRVMQLKYNEYVIVHRLGLDIF